MQPSVMMSDFEEVSDFVELNFLNKYGQMVSYPLTTEVLLHQGSRPTNPQAHLRSHPSFRECFAQSTEGR